MNTAQRREGPDTGQAAPNVLYVTVDSLRSDRVGFLGYDRPTTPVLDGLAERGTACTRAYASGIPTYYSFKSLLGGVPAQGYTPDIGMPADATTVAEAFRDAGYQTAGFNAGNPWLTRDYGYDRGFERFRDFLTDGDEAAESGSGFWAAAKKFREVTERSEFLADKAGLAARTACAFTGRTPLEDAETVTDAAVEWFRTERDEDRPFFLWIHYMDPHYPWVPRAQDLEPFRDGKLSRLEIARLWHTVSYLNHGSGDLDVPPEDVERISDLYDAEVRRTDAAIGRLTDLLQGAGLTDETVVSVVGDHGTELYDHGGFSHGPRTLYDEITRVPLLFAGPGVPEARADHVTSLVDVPATLLRTAGVDVPGSMETFDAGSILDGEHSPAVTDVVYDFEPVTGNNADNGHLVSVVDWPWKLVLNEEQGTRELYHLEEDPDEQADRVTEEAAVVAALEGLIDDYRDGLERANRTVDERSFVRNRVAALQTAGRI